MAIDKYKVEAGDNNTYFEFISEGPRGKIVKVVQFIRSKQLDLFNLGFGDKDIDTGEINDTSVTNNGDSQKVLMTVAETIYLFTNLYPYARIGATGSTKSRTRLYRMGISNNMELITRDFHIFGLIDGQMKPFEKGVDYEAFLIIRKKS